jgi:hypothetical protein
MPVKRGQDSKGCYYRWGTKKKYYYPAGNARKREIAKKKAEAQGRAVYSRGWRER